MARQKTEFSAMPDSRPMRSLTMPTIQGPNIPPRPPKARKTPSVRPVWPGDLSEIMAVEVGKMTE